MSWNHFLNALASEPWLPGLALVLGMALVIFAIVRFKKSNRKGPPAGKPAFSIMFGFFGFGFACFAAFVLVSRPAGLLQFFLTDVADAGGLERLQEAELVAKLKAADDQADWAQWRGPNRDGRSPETGINTDWENSTPEVLWKQPVKGGYSSVSIAGGLAYVTDRFSENEERILCLNAETGAEKWSFVYDANYEDLSSHGEGPRASPTIHGGRVYTVGATGKFHCLEADPADGQPIVHWEYDLLEKFDALLPQWGVACSPLIVGDLVIVQPGGSAGSIAAFDNSVGKKGSGRLVWTALSEVSGYSSPIYAEIEGVPQVICMTGKGVIGLKPGDGKQLWYYSWYTKFDANIATPVVAGNYVFISSGYNSGCALLEITKSGSSGLQAIEVFVKRNKLMRSHHSTCVLHDGHLYGFDDNRLKCIDLRAAKMKWHASNIEKGSVAYVDGHLLVLTQKGQLNLVEATPDELRHKGKMQLLEGGYSWAMPVVADGRVYLRDNEQILCLSLKKPIQEPARDADDE